MKRLVKKLATEKDGNFAILFAFLLPPMLMFAGGAVDYARYNTVRTDLVESLDAAGLAIAQLDALNGPDVRDLSADARKQYLKDYGTDFFHENFRYESQIEGLSVDFVITNTKITPVASGQLSTLILNMVDRLTGSATQDLTKLAITADIEITRAATGNTEVALVLDTTGSMDEGTRMEDLRAAASEFIDVLVRDDQSEFTSKVAIVPYSEGVNVGAQTTYARGAIAPAVAITGINKNSRATITAPGHGFVDDDNIVIRGVNGMSQINSTGENVYRVRNATTDTFQIRNVNENGNSATSSWVDSRTWGTYSSGGEIYCTRPSCRFNYFGSNSGDDYRLFEVTQCVSERIGAQARTDRSVMTDKVGRVYDVQGETSCPPVEMLPLTDDRTTAKETVEDLLPQGGTAGHIGIAWGWYAVSPEFDDMFTGDAAPAAYEDDVAKSVVIMTDGEFNAAFCNGVRARNTNGSGRSTINCDPTNGGSLQQALDICDAMKDEGITIYTVGFEIDNDQSVRDMMSGCASGPSYEFLAEDGEALKRVFADIAQNISQLHISR